MKKTISTKLSHSNITAVTDILTGIPEQLKSLSAGRSSEQLRIPLGQGERSLTEDLAHLINCEARTSEAIYLALLVNQPAFIDVHPERQWGSLLRYDMFDFSALLAYFEFRRLVLLRVLRALTAEQWARTIREEGKQRQESVYWRARALALHEMEHVEDITNKLRVI